MIWLVLLFYSQVSLAQDDSPHFFLQKNVEPWETFPCSSKPSLSFGHWDVNCPTDAQPIHLIVQVWRLSQGVRLELKISISDFTNPKKVSTNHSQIRLTLEKPSQTKRAVVSSELSGHPLYDLVAEF